MTSQLVYSSADLLLFCRSSIRMIEAHRHPYQKTSNDVRQRVISAVLAGADYELASRMLNVKIWTVSDAYSVHG